MGKEQYLPDKSGKIERGAGIVRNGGVIAGVIGLIVSPGFAAAGFGAAILGEIIRGHEKGKRMKQVGYA